ncbi:hypothetical protein [Ruegeria sp. R14_0]|uniref:hypothetical protein n=1 Tax=Ruegeria sp. R14_0 TaxID=2821100 RepID=UPI001ADADA64|nr:hypothetical protein [Ruegeria sp. R14_0]MBO9448218.1 hypothetical protein [Ruegeria sp. R14_0]
MGQPAILALAYLGLSIIWQVVLWMALPNVGMGGLAVIWIVWPLLGVSALGLWMLLRVVEQRKTAVFWGASAAILILTTLVHPQ